MVLLRGYSRLLVLNPVCPYINHFTLYVETMSLSNKTLKISSSRKLKIKKIIFFYAFFFEKFLKK
jgi:hypothetical protein